MPGQQLEQGRRRNFGKAVKIGTRTALLIGFAVKASVGLSDGVPQPLNPQVGNDRSGYAQNDSGLSKTTSGGPGGDGGKNPRIGKNQGNAPGTLVSVDTGSSPPSATDGKNIRGDNRSDTGVSQVVFKNTKGGKNIGPKSEEITKDNATARKNWSAPTSRKVLNIPRPPDKVELTPPQEGPPEWAAQILKGLIGGGPLLSECTAATRAVEPILKAFEPTETPTPPRFPTVTPAAGSDPILSRNLVAYLHTGRILEPSKVEPRDVIYLEDNMKIIMAIMQNRNPNLQITDINVIMPFERGLWDRLQSEKTVAPMIIVIGSQEFTLTTINREGMMEIRAERLPPNPIMSINDGIIYIKGQGINPLTGTPQSDRAWINNVGMAYDPSAWSAGMGGDALDIINAHAAELASASRIIYEANPDAILSVMPSKNSEGDDSLVIRDENSGQSYPINARGQLVRIPRTPKDMRERYENGVYFWERQSSDPDTGYAWETILIFDPDADGGVGAMVNIAAPATPTPTPSPIPTVQPTETPTPTPTPTATPIEVGLDIPLRGSRTIPATLENYSDNGLHTDGATVEPINDDKFGRLLISKSVGGGIQTRRGYPDYKFSEDGGYTITINHLKVSNLSPLPHQDKSTDTWMSVLTAFNKQPTGPNGKDQSLQYMVNIEPKGNGNYRFVIWVYDWMSNKAIRIPTAFDTGERGDPDVAFNEYGDLRIQLKNDGAINGWYKVKNTQGELVWKKFSSGTLPDEARKHIKLELMHALNYGVFNQAEVVNGDIQVDFHK